MGSTHEHSNLPLQSLWDALRVVKEAFGQFQSEHETPTMRRLIFGKQLEAIEKIQHIFSPIDWDNLESWIQNAAEALQRQRKRNLDYVTLLGYDADETSWFDIATHNPVEMIQASPAGQQLRRMFGPNWVARFDALQGFTPAPSLENTLVPERFEASISIRTQKITEYWNKVRKDVRGRSSFRKRWCQLTREARTQWLQMHRIPADPHSHIYAWAQGLEAGNQYIPRSSWMSSLLNMEDLSDINVLPEFLDARASSHPRLFRHADSVGVFPGVYSGYLSMKCVPGMILRFVPEISGVEEYHVLLERSVVIDGASSPSNLNEEAPGIGLLQLEAQQCVYKFLADCLSVGLEGHSPVSGNEPSPRITDDNECPSLLARAMRLDYHGRPGMIDFNYLENLMNASLDEAREDLWQLRQDSAVWMHRLDEASGMMHGCTSNHLRLVFGRIDSFHSLSHRLSVVKSYDLFSGRNHELDISGLSEDPHALGLLMSMHVAFMSVLEEQLRRFESMTWPEATADRSVLFRLLELLRANDPTLRVLDLAAVMRVIDREIEQVNLGAPASFSAMQVLNDVGVIVSCLKESSKHSILVSFVGEHIHLVNDLEVEWERQDRPWRSVMENTLAALGKTTCQKLDKHIHDQDIDAKSRHVDFWQIVDRHMTVSSEGNTANEEVIHEVLQLAPIDLEKPPSAHLQASWVGKPNVEYEITNTMLRRSKNHRSIQVGPPALLTERAAKEQSLPVINPVSDICFWKALSGPSSENISDLVWSDFETAMVNIGYEVHTHGGSGRRFEYRQGHPSSCAKDGTPGTIVFHKPHAKRGRVPHYLARSWWLRRLQKRFELKL